MSQARSRLLGCAPLLIATAVWCLPRSSSAAITVDTPNISSQTATGALSLTWSHTVGAGANRILIVGISHRGNTTVNGVTYGPTALTQIGSATTGAQRGALWYLLAPPQGTANVVVTLTPPTTARIVGGAVTFFGVDQVTPLGTYVSATGNSTTPSVTATSAAGEVVIDTVSAQGSALSLTAAGGQTVLWNTGTGIAGADARGGGSTKAGAANVVMSWTLGVATNWVIGAVPLRPVPLAGRVFEDVSYGGGAGRDQATASGVARANARVELYNGAGNFVSFTTTDAEGVYRFRGIGTGNFTVRVVNSTVTSSRGAGAVPVQTYRTNASTGTAVPVTDYVGGQNPAVADAGNGGLGTTMNTATGVFTAGIAGTALSIANVAVGAPGVSGVDFGFNFDTIVNVNDSGQGSLQQFILNSNALGGEAALAQSGLRMSLLGVPEALPAGRETSIFMISNGAAHPGLRAGLANLLTGGVARMTPAADLPFITGADTSVDGTTQTANVGNTNAVTLGTGGPVGVDALPLGQVAGPEVEIRGNSGTNAFGLRIQAARVVVRGLAILGFGNAGALGAVRVDDFPAALIEGNILGSTATSFTDPGSTAARNRAGVYGANRSTATVQYNLIGFGQVTGIYLDTGAAGWTITGNEVRDTGWADTTDGDGITLNGATTTTLSGNLIVGSSSQGFVVTANATGVTFVNNTVTNNGIGTSSGVAQSPGIAVRSTATAAATLLDRNVIQANYGAGVQVNNGSPTPGSPGTRMTQNSFKDNGTINARNGSLPLTGQIGIDLNSAADNIDLGTSPYFTRNDNGDGDPGGNGLLNFPVLTSATLYAGNLILRGYARPNSVIELFIASADPWGFGEGTTYCATLTEGGAGDTDAGTGTYAGLINGIDQGTDNTNRFVFTIPIPPGVLVGTLLTATATLGGQTSEFSGNVPAANATAVKLVSFEAFPLDSGVRLEWRTGSELDNMGFHVHRGLSAKGPFARLTPSLIPGLGSSPLGQSYSWVDSGLSNGVRYFYELEDVDTGSRSTFHGPVSAVPEPQEEEPPPGDGDDSGSGSGSGPSKASCPAWVLSASESSPSGSPRCTRHGNPAAVSLEVISRSPGHATLELRTGGFWALHEESGAVRVFVPGFDTPTEAAAAALPVRRAWVEAVVGRRVRLVGVQGFDLQSFGGLRPAAVGRAELSVSPDGTVTPTRRAAGAARASRGFTPAELARLAGTVFQGERKSAVVEVTPLRLDGARGRLVLAGLVRVRLVFEGVEPGETGSGSRGRRESLGTKAVGEVLAQLYTTRRGLHGVSYEDVFPGARRSWPTSEVRLQRQGEAVPFHVEPSPSEFGPGSVFYFHADRGARSTDFVGEVAYEVVKSQGEAMEEIAGTPEGAPPVGTSVGTATFEVNRLYQSGLLDASDVWQWEVMTSGMSTTKSFTLEGVDTTSPAPGRVVVDLQGGSESGRAVDHHVLVYVNGTYGGDARFAGKVPQRLEVEVQALREGPNELQVVNAGDTGVSSMLFLDRYSVDYPQRLRARSGLFEGVFGESGTAEVGGLAGPAVVVDVTGAAQWLTGVGTDMGTDGGVVRFRAESGHRYVAASAAALLSPRVVRPPDSTLRSGANQADYLLIGPAEFLGAAEPLLARRASDGLRTRAVSLEEIATVFGHGSASGEAIRAFVSYAYHSWEKPSPRYVVLLGDATYDPQHFVATSWASPLPAVWGKTTYLWTALDPLIGAVNGEDDVPDVAVGRIPATTVEQAEALIGKLVAWEDSGQGLSGKAELVADNPDSAGDFEWNVEDVRTSFLGDRETEVLKVSQLGAGTRPAIQQALDGGLSLMSYVGHGSAALWGSENVWNSWDAPKLLAQSQQPVLLTLTCLNGYFVATNFDSLSESLLKVEGRGAIAAFSPSGMSVDGPAHQYHRAVVSELVSGRHERLGDAVLAAQGLYAETGLLPELLSIYQLLGDPAMRIR